MFYLLGHDAEWGLREVEAVKGHGPLTLKFCRPRLHVPLSLSIMSKVNSFTRAYLVTGLSPSSVLRTASAIGDPPDSAGSRPLPRSIGSSAPLGAHDS